MQAFPPYPTPDRFGPSGQPGFIPLRPLDLGEILGAGFTVLRRRFALLAGVGLAIGLLSSAVTWVVLAASGEVDRYATTNWVEQTLSGSTMAIPSAILVGLFGGLLISVVAGEVLAGLAAPIAGNLAIGRPATGAVRSRLVGRWGLLLGCSALVGVASAVGLLLLVVPGVLVVLVCYVAAPVVAMEGATVGEALRRSAQLTRGHRARIFGITVLVLLIGLLASTLLSAVVGSILPPSDGVTAAITVEALAVLAGAVTGAWGGAVQAVVYIDLRIRSEGLGHALQLAAAADAAAAHGAGLSPRAHPAG